MTSPERARKIAIVGASAVGKSTVTVQFVEKHFVESYYPTIENQFSKPITHNGIEYTTEIIDTAGQDEFSIMSQKLLIGIHGYMLVYAVTSRASFEMIPIIRDKILNATGTDSLPMVIVGNKSDTDESHRQISTQEGQQLAQSLNIPFVETSAKTNSNIDKAFATLIAEIEHTTPTDDKSKCVIC
ncbi:putative GTPase RHB1 [Sugiyamaella lignohabitans]|uniref:Putative GTPase RHB1 n=1 Tax=Sugiyamaella lignohabitans TaxID=796027 RepID=A0A167FID0_9ASCO|nr:putative GTPase RHB1 [Sugiyamaella lignohabitans]ANB15335.1 putative GTPase RHB1 [Sugiyamaella lignohabitans]